MERVCLAFAQSNYLVMSDIKSNILAAKRVIVQMDDPGSERGRSNKLELYFQQVKRSTLRGS